MVSSYFHLDAMTPEAFLKTYLHTTNNSLRPKVRFNDVKLTNPTHLMDRINHSRICPGYEVIENSEEDPLIPEFIHEEKSWTSLLLQPVGHKAWRSEVDAWKSLETHILITESPEMDPFKNEPELHDLRKLILENFVHEQFICQHRTFVLSISISGNFARFVLWDELACLSTTNFDFHKRPHLLAQFFWGYGLLNPAARGFDTTATFATASETRILKRAIRDFIKKSPRKHENLIYSADDYPTYRIRVDGPDNKPMTVIAGRPFYAKGSGTGPGSNTRVYAGYLKSQKRVVILRDYWCREEANFTPDAEMYEYLQEYNIPHIPSMLAGGDVMVDGEPQTTVSSQVLSGNPTPYSHQRIIQDVAFPLSAVNCSKELVQVIRDTVECLSVAYKSADLLHQDISEGNIMMTADGRGLVNDWEIAAKIGGHCGTLAFMSTRMSINPYKVREIHDDLESCFWVLLWVSIHKIKTSAYWPYLNLEVFDGRRYARFKNGVEVDYDGEGGEILLVGGGEKVEALRSEDGLKRMKWRCRPFDALMHRLIDIFGTLVQPLEAQVVDRKQKKPKMPQTTAEIVAQYRAQVEFEFLAEPENLLRILDEALAKDGWLEDDAVPSMLPATTSAWERYEQEYQGPEWLPLYLNHIGPPSHTRYPPGYPSKANEDADQETQEATDISKPASISQPSTMNRKRKKQDTDCLEDLSSKKRKVIKGNFGTM